MVSRNHWTKCFNSLLMIDFIVPSFLTGNIRLVSSANWWMIDFDNTNCMSLKYNRNDKGHRVHPPGTSHVIVLIVLMLDKTPWRKTHCLEFLWKELIPQYSTFTNRLSWFTVLNAF